MGRLNQTATRVLRLTDSKLAPSLARISGCGSDLPNIERDNGAGQT